MQKMFPTSKPIDSIVNMYGPDKASVMTNAQIDIKPETLGVTAKLYEVIGEFGTYSFYLIDAVGTLVVVENGPHSLQGSLATPDQKAESLEISGSIANKALTERIKGGFPVVNVFAFPYDPEASVTCLDHQLEKGGREEELQVVRDVLNPKGVISGYHLLYRPYLSQTFTTYPSEANQVQISL